MALPEHFKLNGYLVTGTGKLYHPNIPPNFDQPKSWSPLGPQGQPWPYLDKQGVNGTNTEACSDSCCTNLGEQMGMPKGGDSHYCLKQLQPNTFLLDQTVRNVAVRPMTCCHVSP